MTNRRVRATILKTTDMGKRVVKNFKKIPLLWMSHYMDMKVQLKEKGIFSSVLHIASNFVADEVFLSIEKN